MLLFLGVFVIFVVDKIFVGSVVLCLWIVGIWFCWCIGRLFRNLVVVLFGLSKLFFECFGFGVGGILGVIGVVGEVVVGNLNFVSGFGGFDVGEIFEFLIFGVLGVVELFECCLFMFCLGGYDVWNKGEDCEVVSFGVVVIYLIISFLFLFFF